MVRIDLGCGNAKKEGAVGFDIELSDNVDVQCDFNGRSVPVKSNSVDEICCRDVIEHLHDTPRFFLELIRIVRKTGGRIYIRTPHYTSRYAYNDPTHVKYFGLGVIDYLMMHNEKTGRNIKISCEKQLLFPKIYRLSGIAWLMNKFPHRYEQVFCYIFPAENMEFNLHISQK